MKTIGFVFVIALAFGPFGCKKGGDCGKAIDKSMELSKADMADKMMQKMKDLGLQHCKDDKWSDDALTCMSEAKTTADSQACYRSKLTKDQQDSSVAALFIMTAPAGNTDGEAGSAAVAGSDTGGGSAGSAAK
jgi:hypothetical protein